MIVLGWLAAIGACVYFGSERGLLAIVCLLLMEISIDAKRIKQGLVDIHAALSVEPSDEEVDAIVRAVGRGVSPSPRASVTHLWSVNTGVEDKPAN